MKQNSTTQSSPTQNPSKVVIVPKPPKGKVDTPVTPDVTKEELDKSKLEEVKDVIKDVTEVKDTLKADKTLPSK